MQTLPKEYLGKFREFDGHDKVVKVEDKGLGLLGFIAIHRSKQGVPALGATRLWHYASEEDALRDALRLSHLMSYKSALAGLPYTGGKAVLIRNNFDESKRKEFFRAYARAVDNLSGEFVTGTDVGVKDSDIAVMKQKTAHVIGVGVGPAYHTAMGVFYGIEVCLRYIFGSTDVRGKTIAIQGLGKVGLRLAKILSENGAKIVGTDVNEQAIKKAMKEILNIKIVKPDEIYSQICDVFSPCALNGIINKESVAQFRCKVVCGSANNQLSNNLMGEILSKNEILYAPDFVVNSGGLISVVDEFENGAHDDQRINNKLSVIHESLEKIFEENKKTHQATNIIANKIAEEFMSQ